MEEDMVKKKTSGKRESCMENFDYSNEQVQKPYLTFD